MSPIELLTYTVHTSNRAMEVRGRRLHSWETSRWW